MGWVKENAKTVFCSLIAGVLLKYAIEPAVPFLPDVPFLLFNVIATVITFLFLALILYGIWWLIKGSFKLLTKQETRAVLRVKVRDWQPTRLDLALAIIFAYTLGQGVLIIAVTSTIPRNQLQGIASSEQLTTLFGVMIVPIMVSMCIMLVWYGYEQYQGLRKQWESSDQKNRKYIVLRVSLFVAVATIFVTGNLLGWDDRLWFSAA